MKQILAIIVLLTVLTANVFSAECKYFTYKCGNTKSFIQEIEQSTKYTVTNDKFTPTDDELSKYISSFNKGTMIIECNDGLTVLVIKYKGNIIVMSKVIATNKE